MASFSGTGNFTADGGKVHDIRFNTSGAVELNADVRGISGSSDVEIDGGSLMDSEMDGALLISGVGIHVNNVKCVDVEISGNRCVVDDLHSMFADGVGVTISGNENRVRGRVYVAPEHGVLISGDDNDVEMVVAESGNDASNTYDNIQITGNANYVHDCKLTPRPAGNTTRYGINVVSGAGNIVVGHELGDLTDYGTGGLADTGTGTLIGPGAHEWDLDLPANRTDGDVIVWDDIAGKFILDEVTGSGVGGGGAETLDDLTDVDTAGVVDGDVLKFNSGTNQWEAADDEQGSGVGGGAESIDDLSDVDVTGVATGDVLKYNGTTWVPADDEEGSGVSGGGGAEEISDLTDVDTASVSDGDLLQWDAGQSLWIPVDVDTLGLSGVGEGGGSDPHLYRAAVIPSSPNAFDEEFDTDPTGSWTWLNQSTADVTVDTARGVLTLHDNRNVNDISMIGKAPPSGDWTVEAMIYPWVVDIGTARSFGALAVRYGSTINAGGAYLLNDIRELTWSSDGAGTASGNGPTAFTGTQQLGPLFVRVAWDDTAGTLAWYMSFTGVLDSWIQIHSFSPGSTPDLVGFGGVFNKNHFLAYSFEYLRRVA